MCLITLVAIGVCWVSDWYSSNYVKVDQGEIAYDGMHIERGKSFAFEDIGSLVFAENVIDERGPRISINTEQKAADIVSSLAVKILDADMNILDTPKPKVTKLHTIKFYTTYKLMDAAYFSISHNDIEVICDAGDTALLGLYL